MAKDSSKKKKKAPRLTVASLLKSLKKKRKKKKAKKPPQKSNLPSAEVQKGTLETVEYGEELYITEEEALGPELQNESYLTLSRRYKWVRWGVVVLLFAFLFFMFTLFKEEITIENFRYLIRNVNFELKTELTEAGTILYDSDETNVFAIYKDSLAVANGQKLTIYDSGGRSSCTAAHQYSVPALAASDKYLIAYDRAGGAYAIYTTFSQMHSDKTGYPISAVDVTDDGIYAIASRSKEYFGEVTIYSSSFQLMNRIRKNKYIASLDLSSDGKTILIASYTAGDSGFTTELMTLRVDSDEPDLLFTLEDTLPYRVQWTEDGEFMLASSEGIIFFDRHGKVYNEYIFSGQNVIKYSLDESGAAILTASDSDSNRPSLHLLDRKGKACGSWVLSGIVDSLTLCDGRVGLIGKTSAWMLEDGRLRRYDTDRSLQAILIGDAHSFICSYTRVLTPEWKDERP